MDDMLRHEWKYEINTADIFILRQRLNAVAQPDAHSRDGTYIIRSLYFDNLNDKALREKIDGVNHREKYRLRYYNGNNDFIRLEKKSKINGLCKKEGVNVTKEEVSDLLAGKYQWMLDESRPLVNELYVKMMLQGLRPRTIVEYTRDAFVYGPGNVRVTLDYNIRTGLNSIDFLNSSLVTIPAGDTQGILEVKWDEFLPDTIKSAVSLKGRRVGAFSKYATCRIYG